YTISSFSTMVNALLASGGPNRNGTLRRIELKRGGKTIAVFDTYAMLMQGDKTQDIRLQAGDVIYIPQVGDLIGIAGEVQKPGIYELNGSTKVEDLLWIAGGLNARTFTGRIQYYRVVDHAYASVVEGTLAEFKDMVLNDGDILRLYPVFNYSTSVLITGALFNPGTYAIVPGYTRIADIIKRSGGLIVTASNKAIISRVTPSLEGPVNERFTIDLHKALEGDPMNNMTLEANDKITVMVIPEWQGQLTVTITGEVKCPGTYYMFQGEKISDLIERAEGFTAKAFLRGAVFTRRSVAAQQRVALSEMADQMEIDLLEATQNSTEVTGAELNRRRQLIRKLRTIDIMGRVVTKIDTPKNIRDTEWDYELEDGDVLRIPTKPLTVNIMGAVYAASSQTYRSNMSINSYVNAAGGATKTAHKRMLYLIKSDGTILKLTRTTAMMTSKQWKAPPGYSAKVEPGDTIVVPVKYTDRQSFENLRDTIDLIYKTAVSVGVFIKN
ncbi:MAG: SLBB domain-containing protein, partial [Synergistaceae bacterium]|nr:SLBB domain-containing protein [Synergistaceae bacterium]